MKITLVKDILSANDRIADENRELFEKQNNFVINMMSSPGAGKTTLLVRTINELKKDISIGVIEGDIQTSYDAEQIEKTGVPVTQINTGGACHLDGNMIRESLVNLPLEKTDLLIVENVGNLVCPAEFNVGEDYKVMILSVAEGDDKPKKYPLMFHESKVLLINKIDLLPHLDVSVEKIKSDAKGINPDLEIFEVSGKTGEGMENWYNWLKDQVNKKT